MQPEWRVCLQASPGQKRGWSWKRLTEARWPTACCKAFCASRCAPPVAAGACICVRCSSASHLHYPAPCKVLCSSKQLSSCTCAAHLLLSRIALHVPRCSGELASASYLALKALKAMTLAGQGTGHAEPAGHVTRHSRRPAPPAQPRPRAWPPVCRLVSCCCLAQCLRLHLLDAVSI